MSPSKEVQAAKKARDLARIGKPPSARMSGRSLKARILQFVKSEEGAKLSRTEVAARFNSSETYVSRVCVSAGLGRTRGVTPRSPKGPIDLPKPSGRGESDPDKAVNMKGYVPSEARAAEDIIADGTLSVTEQRKELSWLALNAARDEAKVAAHRALQQLDQAMGTQTKYGPGEPLTREDKTYRLSLLMEACGTEIVKAAYAHAFTEQITQTEPIVEVADAQSGALVRGVDGDGDALGDGAGAETSEEAGSGDAAPSLPAILDSDGGERSEPVADPHDALPLVPELALIPNREPDGP